MSQPAVLYMGDTALTDAAAYLAGLLTDWQIGYDYVPSAEPADSALFDGRRRLFVLSDYPAAMLAEAAQSRLVQQVALGAGLLMIGGWESFCGQGGNWADTPVAQALPVHVMNNDDRVHCDQPALIRKLQGHPIVDDLPWKERPPAIGGFNRIRPKPEAITLLEVQRFAARYVAEAFVLAPTRRHPLLVVGQHGQGRTAALATDLAPHWVGGLVDWGTRHLAAQAPGGNPIEVGCDYAQFCRQLFFWTGKLGEPPGDRHSLVLPSSRPSIS